MRRDVKMENEMIGITLHQKLKGGKHLSSIIKSTLEDASDTSSKLSYDLTPKLLKRREQKSQEAIP